MRSSSRPPGTGGRRSRAGVAATAGGPFIVAARARRAERSAIELWHSSITSRLDQPPSIVLTRSPMSKPLFAKKMVILNAPVPASMRTRLRKDAKKRGLSMAAYVRNIIMEHFNNAA